MHGPPICDHPFYVTPIPDNKLYTVLPTFWSVKLRRNILYLKIVYIRGGPGVFFPGKNCNLDSQIWHFRGFSVNFWRFQGSVTGITEGFSFLPLNYRLRRYLIWHLKIRRSPYLLRMVGNTVYSTMCYSPLSAHLSPTATLSLPPGWPPLCDQYMAF